VWGFLGYFGGFFCGVLFFFVVPVFWVFVLLVFGVSQPLAPDPPT